MKVKGIIIEDFINYKKPSMTIMFPHCIEFKCGAEHCQNSPLSRSENIEIDISDVIIKYLNNPITKAIVMQGLEPFDSWNDLIEFIDRFRKSSDDDIVIYTGYYKEEIADKRLFYLNIKILSLNMADIFRIKKNIMIKFWVYG